MKGNQKGMAIVLVLAVISFLVAVTVQLAVSVGWQMQAAARQEKSIELDGAVLGGMNIIRAALYADQKGKIFDSDSSHDSWYQLDQKRINQLFPDMDISVKVKDLSGKIQINRLVHSGQTEAQADMQRELWLRFLMYDRFAVEGKDEATVLVDALSDWLDEDDYELGNGAEAGFYLAKGVDYSCRNGPVQSLEELLLVRGFSQKLIYGDDEYTGIIDFLSVDGLDGKININTAPLEVLMAMGEEISEDDIQLLLDFRNDGENREFLNDPEWYRQVHGFPSGIVFAAALVTTTSSWFFVRIEAQKDGFRRQGQGTIFRDPDTREQRLVRWRVE
jgi:general secretion pathway protein K